MRSWFFVFTFFILLGCGCTTNESAPQGIEHAEPSPDLPPIVGKWKVDSSGFITNGIQQPLEAPGAGALWEFTKDGRLIISANISLSTNYRFSEKGFRAKMMGLDTEYEIRMISAHELVLVSTLSDSKSVKREMISKLERVQ